MVTEESKGARANGRERIKVEAWSGLISRRHLRCLPVLGNGNPVAPNYQEKKMGQFSNLLGIAVVDMLIYVTEWISNRVQVFRL